MQLITITTDLVISSANGEVLLVKRSKDPFRGMWALPGGKLRHQEKLSCCAARELEEETGLTIPSTDLQLVDIKDGINRDPRGRFISIIFAATLGQVVPVQGGSDAEEAEWFDLRNLPSLAFDHQQILESLAITIDRSVS